MMQQFTPKYVPRNAYMCLWKDQMHLQESYSYSIKMIKNLKLLKGPYTLELINNFMAYLCNSRLCSSEK